MFIGLAAKRKLHFQRNWCLKPCEGSTVVETMESTSLAKTSEKESPATCSSTAINSATSNQGKGTRLLRFRNNVIPAVAK